MHVDITQVIIGDKQKRLINDCPFKITKILTDNGAQFTYELLAEHLKPKDKTHPFDVMYKAHTVEHRLTKFKHPWTNGQVEIFNKTIKKFRGLNIVIEGELCGGATC